MLPAVRGYVKENVLQTIGDQSQFIRNTVGTIITTIAVKERLEGWPNLLGTLAELLDNPKVEVVDGALGALGKICEDIPQVHYFLLPNAM